VAILFLLLLLAHATVDLAVRRQTGRLSRRVPRDRMDAVPHRASAA
jgi:hypothetical protein